MNLDLYVAILAGGAGKRFWPLSRAARPKQFAAIASERPMVVETLDRALSIAPPERIVIVGSAEHREVLEELACARIPRENLLLEPIGRDTAAAIGWAALVARSRAASGDALLAVFPADHVIGPLEGFKAAIDAAARWALASDDLVTFGIRPSYPATGYGYIRRGAPRPVGGSIAIHAAAEFCEKPDLARATAFLAGRTHFWNSGIFLWRAGRILEELRRFLPELASGLDAIAGAAGTAHEARVLAERYGSLPRISIDYGVMERARGIAMVEADFEWDDVGSWEAVSRHVPADSDGNHVRGSHVGLASSGNVVLAPDGHLVATIGLEGFAIVVTADATLICPLDRAQDVKKLVERLEQEGIPAWL